jgi:SAM-dependent methyltransferase
MLARAADRSERLVLSRGSGEALDFPAASFDLVFTVDVIHHVDDRFGYFREAARVLRPGGRVCTVTDSEWIIRNRQPLSAYFPETVDVDLNRYPTLTELAAAMQDAGLVQVADETVELVGKLIDIGPFREKAYSCLRLIPEDAFQRGIARMEDDLRREPIAWIPRYCLMWGTKPAAGSE